jgi:hypothetical protein
LWDSQLQIFILIFPCGVRFRSCKALSLYFLGPISPVSWGLSPILGPAILRAYLPYFNGLILPPNVCPSRGWTVGCNDPKLIPDPSNRLIILVSGLPQPDETDTSIGSFDFLARRAPRARDLTQSFQQGYKSGSSAARNLEIPLDIFLLVHCHSIIPHARNVTQSFPQGCTLGSSASQKVEISWGLSRSTSMLKLH